MSLGTSIRRSMLLFLTGLFLVCMCSLMLQIMETRLLSVMTWYYLAFFAISMAMFGMTAGSLFVYFKANFFQPKRLLEHLSWIGSAFAIAVVISTLSMTSTVVLAGLTSAVMALLWCKLILIILPPYVFAGMAISLALTQSPCPVGIVYGVDLVGAAAGCLLVLGLLTWMDGDRRWLPSERSAQPPPPASGPPGAVTAMPPGGNSRSASGSCCGILLRSPCCLLGWLVQQFASATRDHAPAGEGTARNNPAGRAAMELVLSGKGAAGDDRRAGYVGAVAEHAAGGSATADDEHRWFRGHGDVPVQ
jgi:hypothetical protein